MNPEIAKGANRFARNRIFEIILLADKDNMAVVLRSELAT